MSIMCSFSFSFPSLFDFLDFTNEGQRCLKERGGGQTFSTSFWMRFSQAPLCRYHFKIIFDDIIFLLSGNIIGMFESPKCDVNPQPYTRGIGPLVGRTSGYRRSVVHVLAVMFSITYHFSFICQYIFIRVKWSDREICPL